MYSSKNLNPKNDVAFAHVFGTVKNKNILLAMLNAVLKEQLQRPIETITFVRTILSPEAAARNTIMLDVFCQDQNTEQYIIKVQIAPQGRFQDRVQSYVSKAYESQCKERDIYKNFKKVIFLAFTDYILFPKKEAYKTHHKILDVKTGEQNLKGLSFTFVELPKFSQQCGNDIAKLSLEEKFYYFLTKAPWVKEKELKALVGKDKIIQKAFEAIDSKSWSNAQLSGYEKEEKNERDYRSTLFKAREEGIEKGRKEGIQQGVEKGIRMLAQQIKKAGVPQDIIEKAMGQQKKPLKAPQFFFNA